MSGNENGTKDECYEVDATRTRSRSPVKTTEKANTSGRATRSSERLSITSNSNKKTKKNDLSNKIELLSDTFENKVKLLTETFDTRNNAFDTRFKTITDTLHTLMSNMETSLAAGKTANNVLGTDTIANSTTTIATPTASQVDANVFSQQEDITMKDDGDCNVTNVTNENWTTVTHKRRANEAEAPRKKILKKIPFNTEDPNDNRFKALLVDVDDVLDANNKVNFPKLLPLTRRIAVTTNVSTPTQVNKNNNKVNNNNTNTNEIINSKASTSRTNITNPNINNENISKDKKEKKPPPITVYNLDLKSLRESLKEFNSFDYKIRQGANNNRSLIFAESALTYENLINILQADGAKFFHLTPKDQRGLSLIVKNIPLDFSAEDIMSELVSLNFGDSIEKVVPLIEFGKQKFNYFIIKLKPGASPDKLYNLRHLFHVRVYFEKFNRTDIVQCFKCQRPGHVSSNCHMEQRCLKCGDNHISSLCKITQEQPRNTLFCILCKQNGHPSNYRGCSVIKKLIQEKIRNKNTTKKENLAQVRFRNESVNNTYNPNRSFADAVRINNPTVNANNARNINNNYVNTTFSQGNNIIDFLDCESYELFGCDYATLDTKFRSYMVTVNNASTPAQRKSALFNFMLEINNNV